MFDGWEYFGYGGGGGGGGDGGGGDGDGDAVGNGDFEEGGLCWGVGLGCCGCCLHFGGCLVGMEGGGLVLGAGCGGVWDLCSWMEGVVFNGEGGKELEERERELIYF